MSVTENNQQSLVLAKKREIIVLDEQVIANQPSTLAAFNLMPSAHGITNQTICHELPMDKAQWSKICSGSAHFEMNKISRLMDICGSEAFLHRLNWERGYESLPPKRKSQLERELEVANRTIAEQDLKLKHWQEFANG